MLRLMVNICLLGAISAAAWETARAADSASLALRDDASLCDVCFVDPQHGWAVGERGVIWHTRDGGRRWQLQESGVDCRLSAVQFVDAQRGWAAGGSTEPYSHVSHAVLLRTRDGGRTWNAIPQPLLGSILRLKFVDARRGWAVCVPNGLCPGGVAVTDDGGQDWTPLAHSSLTPWSCGDFTDAQNGALAGDSGAAASVKQGECRSHRTEADIRRPAALRLAGDGRGYLIGEGGLLLQTTNNGAAWRPAGKLPDMALEMDFRTIAISGNNVWLAGSPGNHVIRSLDHGATWQSFTTGTTLPIQSLTFVDAERGWAVGALGQILATADGGQTWQMQRGAGRRAAYLAVFGEAADVPQIALARLSAGEGYRGVVSLVARRDLESPEQPPLVTRVRQREALSLAGASEVSAAWRFPLRQAGLGRTSVQLIEDWRRATGDDDPLQCLEERLVRELRCWRPEIVITHAANPRGDEPLGHLINQAVLRAVKRVAADGQRVHRVIAMLEARQRGSFSLASTQVLPQLGSSLADQTASARGLLFESADPGVESLSFAPAWDESPLEQGLRDFFSGLQIRAPSDARREALPEAAASLEQMRRLAQRRQALSAIVAHPMISQRGRAAWLAQIGALTRDLDDASAALLLYQVGCQYREQGQTELAAETFDQLAQKYSAQPGLAAAAALWLTQYYGSGELAVCAVRQGKLPVQLARAEQPAAEAPRAPRPTASLIPSEEGGSPAGASPAAPEQSASGSHSPKAASTGDSSLAPATLEGGAPTRTALALQWSRRLEQISPHLAAEPRAILPVASQLDNTSEQHPSQNGKTNGRSQRLLLGLARSRAADAWWSCAAAENGLRDAVTDEKEPPKPIWNCRKAAQKPHLDGKLDDTCWRAADGAELPGIALRSALGDDAAWPTAVQLAYDDEFLYVAISCRQAPGVRYDATATARKRDADLTQQDRVALMFDIDRDWTTYWRLAVDHRGQTAEDCWGDRTWNPTWFVAVNKQPTTWTCEAAIPFAELTAKPPQRGDIWAAGLQRTAPGAGFQSASTPASAATVQPEGFGLLRFQ